MILLSPSTTDAPAGSSGPEPVDFVHAAIECVRLGGSAIAADGDQNSRRHELHGHPWREDHLHTSHGDRCRGLALPHLWSGGEHGRWGNAIPAPVEACEVATTETPAAERTRTLAAHIKGSTEDLDSGVAIFLDRTWLSPMSFGRPGLADTGLSKERALVPARSCSSKVGTRRRVHPDTRSRERILGWNRSIVLVGRVMSDRNHYTRRST